MIEVAKSSPNLGPCLDEIITRPESMSNDLPHRRSVFYINQYRHQKVDEK
jgi:hypothetical protein